MKPLTLLALILLSCGSAGASTHIITSEWYDPYNIKIATNVRIDGFHADGPGVSFDFPDGIVIRGTESFTLSDFVSSGRFCEWNGQHVTGEFKSNCAKGYEWCYLERGCHRRIKVTEEREVWEK